MLAVALRG